MSKRFILYLTFICLWMLGMCSRVFADTVYKAHTQVELVSELRSVKPGTSFFAGLRFKTDPEWHVYWRNPGDSGMAPDIQWNLPADIQAGDILWPYPSLIQQPPLASYGYENETLLTAAISVPENFSDNTLVVKAHVRWLACKIECVPGKADLLIELPVSKSEPVLDQRWLEIFNETRKSWPIISQEWKLKAVFQNETLVIDLEGPHKLTDVIFFPESPALIRHAQPQNLNKTKNGYRLKVPLSVNAPKDIKKIEGVLVSSGGWGGPTDEKALKVLMPVSAGSLERLPDNVSSNLSILTAVIFAFLGGIILNLMPCVLPVLSLKVISFMKEVPGNPRILLAQGIFFTAGVIISFWFLAAAMFIFQSAGRQIGWGFQLQSPVFLITLSFIFFLFALNLFGFFEITIPLIGSGLPPVRRRGFSGAFFNGLFATVVATPCTAPFMGTALGFTLSQPFWVSFAVFTSLGMGMSFPFFALCSNPSLLRWVPKPGVWMETLKQFLGFPLLATVFWLAWVLGQQKGLQAVLGLFFGMFICFFGIWTGNLLKRSGIIILSSLIGAMVSIWSLPTEKIVAQVTADQTDKKIAWKNFSESALKEAREQGKAVFIDFTAAWCLTCQVNERVVLGREEIAAEFKKKDIVSFKADWTSYDPEISQALSRYGRNSIPLYIFYPSGINSRAITLPEILTVETVLSYISRSE